MPPPNHRNRTAAEIVSEHVYHDALGFGYRATSWLDLAKRSGNFAALHYACIDARLAIEHLIFEQLVITAGKALTREAYERCLAEPRKLDKLLARFVPDYERLQEFTEIVASLSAGPPPINRWKIKGLMKNWGVLSAYLHWSGAPVDTTENAEWQDLAVKKSAEIIEPLWEKMGSGHSACMRPEDMKPPSVRSIWEDFRIGRIDEASARVRLEIVRPLSQIMQPEK